MAEERKSLLILCRRAPGGSAQPRELLDIALSAAAFDCAPQLLFADDGVCQLLPGQPFAGLIEALPVYGIERIFVDAQALARRGIDPARLLLPATPLAAEQIADLLEAQQLLLGG